MEDKGGEGGKMMMEITVLGDPVSWQRPRAGRSPSGKPFFFEAKKVKSWKAYLRDCFREARERVPSPPGMTLRMFGGDPKNPIPVTVEVRFYLKRPKKYYRKKDFDGPIPCTSRPDVDNLYKGLVDAMQGVVFRDDSVVWTIIVSKWYHAKGAEPGTHIRVEELEPRSG